MLDRKSFLMGGVFLGVGIYALPIFLKGVPALPIKIAGGIFMAAGVIAFIAWDTLTGNAGGPRYSKDIKQKLKKGLISEQQAFELQKQQFEKDMVMAKQKIQLAKQKAELDKVKQQTKSKMDLSGLTGTKPGEKKNAFPDVLGNISPMFSGTEPKKKKNQDDLRDLF